MASGVHAVCAEVRWSMRLYVRFCLRVDCGVNARRPGAHDSVGPRWGRGGIAVGWRWAAVGRGGVAEGLRWGCGEIAGLTRNAFWLNWENVSLNLVVVGLLGLRRGRGWSRWVAVGLRWGCGGVAVGLRWGCGEVKLLWAGVGCCGLGAGVAVDRVRKCEQTGKHPVYPETFSG